LAVAPDGTPYVAWDDNTGGNGGIYVRRWNGTSWAEVGEGSASGGGISSGDPSTYRPSLAIASDGKPYVAWDGWDYSNGGDREIHVRRWAGNGWEEVGDGSASDGGISRNTGDSWYSSLAIARDGTPYVAWIDDTSGNLEIYVRRGIGPCDVGQSVHTVSTGWNLLAPNLETTTPTDAEGALTEVGASASAIYRWLSESDTWEGHIQGKPFGNFALELGQGYFLKATTDGTWSRYGTYPDGPVAVPIHPVWTLAGLPMLGGLGTAADLLADANAQGGACSQVARWNNQISDWDIYVPALPGSDFALANHEGYFIECANAITYTPGEGEWHALALNWPPASEQEALAPVADPAISDIQVTNRRDVAFSVTWRTDRPSPGWVEYGETTALSHTAHDDQGEGAVSQVHHVTLTGLRPETTYYFRIHSGQTVDDNDGALYQAMTKATEMPPMPYLAYGQVQTSDGQPAVGALVRAKLVDGAGNQSEPLSTVVDGWEYWSLSLPLEGCEGMRLKLEVLGREGSEAEMTVPACDVKPVATVVLADEGLPPRESAVEIHLPLILRRSP
jgi:hypothetical protein